MRAVLFGGLCATALLMLFGGSSLAQQRGVKPPVRVGPHGGCVGIENLPEPDCCRVAVLITVEGKTGGVRANCNRPESVPVAISCKIQNSYEPATRFGKPIPFVAHDSLVLGGTTPKWTLRQCEKLDPPQFTDQ